MSIVAQHPLDHGHLFLQHRGRGRVGLHAFSGGFCEELDAQGDVSSIYRFGLLHIRSLASLPGGTYRVQAIVNRYETFRRSDGHVVKLPPDKWEGQQWASKPGNLYSLPRTVTLDPSRPEVVRLDLDREIPPVADFAKLETKYVKHLRIKSERLTKFWGLDMFLGAWILLPWGFEEHPDARYPVVINHGHFPSSLGGWRESPPDPNLKPDYSERFSLAGYNRIQPYLINTARGELVDEAALYEAIQNKRLRGAALDVFSPEPPSPDNPLLSLPEVIVTPHCGSHTDGATDAMGWRALRECLAVLRGEPPKYPITENSA